MFLTLILASLTVGAAQAQDPVKAFPTNYSLVLHNPQVAVIRVHYGPREKVGVHDHSAYPTIYVYLNDSGPVKFAHYEEKPFDTVRPPTVPGSFRVAPGRRERHTVENLADTPSDFLRVELKQARLTLKHPFRGKAPAHLDRDMDEVAFTDGQLRIERVVCVGRQTCPLKPSASASLLVAITSAHLASGEKLSVGAVRWLSPGSTAAIQPAAAPAEVLRILIPARAQ